jgi:short-subunit dehydrogenase
MPTIRRLFVTGATTGLGHGLADHYARDGAHLGIVARREELLREHAAAWPARGAMVEVYAGDVADVDFMEQSANAFCDAAGGVDLVFANAGVNIPSKPLEGQTRDIAWLIGVNVIGVTNTITPFVPRLVAQRSGVLAAVSSVAGHAPLPGRGPYSASKAAVTTFMSSLRMDLADTGVHAMTLCPGFVHTPLTEGNPDMPFVIECDEAVKLMVDAIDAKKDTFTFPWQMDLLSKVMKAAPESWIQRMAPTARKG